MEIKFLKDHQINDAKYKKDKELKVSQGIADRLIKEGIAKPTDKQVAVLKTAEELAKKLAKKQTTEKAK